MTTNAQAPGSERRQRLVAELGGIAVEEAAHAVVPRDLGGQADEQDPGEAGDPVGRQDVERLADPGPGTKHDHAARQHTDGAEHHRPPGADEAGPRG